MTGDSLEAMDRIMHLIGESPEGLSSTPADRLAEAAAECYRALELPGLDQGDVAWFEGKLAACEAAIAAENRGNS